MSDAPVGGEPNTPAFSAVIEAESELIGSRLDAALVALVPHMTRALASAAIRAGDARRNGRRAKKGDRVESGDRISLRELPAPADFVPRPWVDSGLTILHADPFVVAIDKPRGVPSHPLRRDEYETAAQALLGEFPELEGVGYALREPGILHRLDTDTSGVLVAARTKESFEELVARQRNGEIEKHYVALVEGVPRAPDRVEVGIGPSRDVPERVDIDYAAEPRCTEILSAEPLGPLTLADGARVLISAVTMRVEKATRHQIRAHLAHHGHPLLGDVLYGGAAIDGDDSHWLHAARVVLPAMGHQDASSVVIEAPWPAAMRAMADRALNA